ncbi:MAG: glycoside hydrolase family 3 C-terminal domain-containing protein [Lachnospiraceae bacterium]|nr:glycoside hydrolase family 3 C-terminal domain-containing protein [Lachnospiraceae bacterium]
MILKKRGFSGTLSNEISEREIAHRELSRRSAAEGMVLLKNDGVLPLKGGDKVALYGYGARYTIKGGTGSGSVNNRVNVCVDEGLRNAGLVITNDAWLDDYDDRYNKAFEDWKNMIYKLAGTPLNFENLYRAHAANPMQAPQGAPVEKTDTDVAIYVISRISGEGADRKEEKGDYYLSDSEHETLAEITKNYKKTIVVINAGGIIDTNFMEEFNISALIIMSQAGMEGGNALADVITGAVNPCGRLTDTWAFEYSDYPSWETFSHNNGNIIEEKYYEDIYVGYRYFESFDKKVRYPFGAGLSYTSFEQEPVELSVKKGEATVKVKVTNTGKCAGKEVVFVYASAPVCKWKKEKRRLVAFEKTALLAAGESETLTISFKLEMLESYHTAKASYYLDEGKYYIMSETAECGYKMAGALETKELIWTRNFENICPLKDALPLYAPLEERMREWRDEYEKEFVMSAKESIVIDDYITVDTGNSGIEFDEAGVNKILDADGADEYTKKAIEIMRELPLAKKATLCCGRPSSGSSEFIGNAAVTVPGAAGETTPILKDEFDVANIVLADGPAGIRIQQRYEEDPNTGKIFELNAIEKLENRFFAKEFLHEGSTYHYQYCSAIPVGTLLAQTFDKKLVEEVGKLIGVELEEFGVTLWLAPGMNIHRNPLCGRNFEYYSEDPVVSGWMAAALTKGVQSLGGVGTTIKHFACNNQEENRRGVSSIVSERALREIYLKGFEIAVKESNPMSIMTSYNKINGEHTANSYDLITEAARKEWGFTGIVMTDWTTTNADGGSSAAKCIAAGNDLVMPGTQSDIQEIIDAVNCEENLSLDEQLLDECVVRMLRVILKSNAYENAKPY